MTLECAREQDVLDAIGSARWPDRCDEELRAHVAGCDVCGDLAAILGPMSGERELAWDEARVPPASVVWWRAQLRARDEAMRAAARPLTAVYALALVFFGAVAGGAFVVMVPRLRAWTAAAMASVRWPTASELTSLVSPLATSTIVLLALCTWLVLAPVAIWFAVKDDR